MGTMIDGAWHKDGDERSEAGGRFVRATTSFRNTVTADGSSGFKAEPGRYHLYVSHACPWAHRTMILRALRKLEDVISVSVVDPFTSDEGWHFSDGAGCIPDTVNGTRYLREIYKLAKDDYTGRVSVPVLWDKRKKTIVNNESAEIIRMLNVAFNGWGNGEPDLYPAPLRDEIDAINEPIYEHVNNGVYKTGFARSQAAYEDAFDALFATLDALEARLCAQRYLAGERITEADWRLFPTLVRFDAVLCRALQVQPAPDRGLSQPEQLRAGAIPVSGDRRHGEHGAHQGALLRQPCERQSHPHRAQGAGTRLRPPARSRPLIAFGGADGRTVSSTPRGCTQQ